ncbi:MAG TPA: trypsin-like peptidase domain-containing protein [Armatimonadota bacterium]|nr:trypsin-like peptidase domain-containing protein [Armatimonadota bacterium]
MKNLFHTIAACLALGLGVGVGQGMITGRAPTAAWAENGQAVNMLAATPMEEQSIVRVVRDVSPAVVSVDNRDDSGSGVFIEDNGLILTNAHVVDRARNVSVGLADGRRLRGRVIGADSDADIAIVKVQGDHFPTAPLANSNDINVGETAIAIGNPVGLDRSVTRGVVSALNRSSDEIGLSHLIQTDAAINPGNSGGPLLDTRGRVIGIVTAAMHSRRISGLGFAIPINNCMTTAHHLIAADHGG